MFFIFFPLHKLWRFCATPHLSSFKLSRSFFDNCFVSQHWPSASWRSVSQTALFGEGTYLSGELSVSMPYAPTGTGWNRSRIGHMLSCVAVCEIIDDPSVKCQIKGQCRICLAASCTVAGIYGTVLEDFFRFAFKFVQFPSNRKNGTIFLTSYYWSPNRWIPSSGCRAACHSRVHCLSCALPVVSADSLSQ